MRRRRGGRGRERGGRRKRRRRRRRRVKCPFYVVQSHLDPYCKKYKKRYQREH